MVEHFLQEKICRKNSFSNFVKNLRFHTLVVVKATLCFNLTTP